MCLSPWFFPRGQGMLASLRTWARYFNFPLSFWCAFSSSSKRGFPPSFSSINTCFILPHFISSKASLFLQTFRSSFNLWLLTVGQAFVDAIIALEGVPSRRDSLAPYSACLVVVFPLLLLMNFSSFAPPILTRRCWLRLSSSILPASLFRNSSACLARVPGRCWLQIMNLLPDDESKGRCDQRGGGRKNVGFKWRRNDMFFL